jgi:hypothetical protein
MPILYPPVVVSLNTAIPIPVLNCPVVLLKILHLPLYYMIVLFVRLNCPSLKLLLEP